ncbi:MAG: gingipain R [Candidatus Cloacimonetes bacterium]|nr:gingipain R [Candidatus Cloacimonadota bacterium]
MLIAFIALPAILGAQTQVANSSFSLMRSSDDGIQLRFQLPTWKLEETNDDDGITRQRVKMEGVPYLYLDETETLPVFSTSIAIPYQGGVSLEIANTASQTQALDGTDFDVLLSRERAMGRHLEQLYPAQSVILGEPMIMRDFRIVHINVHPFQYDQEERQLRVNESVEIVLNFTSTPSINEMEAPSSYSSVYEPLYRDLILNYEQALNRNASFSTPRMLVIYGNYNDTIYQSKVNEYVDWKKQRGFIVNAVSTATTGTSSSAIKTYIQTQYNNTATRPDYVVLIGDSGTGNMQIPTFSSYVDYEYTWLEGNDQLGDVIIGRISVENTAQMINYMAKVAVMEQNLNLNNSAFLDRMVLVGHTSPSGISTIYTNEYVADISSAVNPDYTYTKEYGGSVSNSNITSSINQGVAYYNYRGWINMNGWPNDISNLNNSNKLFHAVFLTCSTGGFHNTESTTEKVVRHGDQANPRGAYTAIGMYGASTTTPQNNCLDMGIFHSIMNVGVRDMGSAMLYAKLYLHAVYGVSNPSYAQEPAKYCNLIGDPTGIVYVGAPSSFDVTAPTSVPAGTSHVAVTVKDADLQPVSGARVTLTNTAGAQIIGFSGTDGVVSLALPAGATGSLNLTVSKDDFKAYTSSVSVDASGGLVYDAGLIDDDNSAPSSGNNNQIINAGETIEFFAQLKNNSSVSHRPTGYVIMNDPYLTLVGSDRVTYPTIAAGQTDVHANAIVFSVARNCPDNYETGFNLQMNSNLQSVNVWVPITVSSPQLEYMSHTLIGSSGNVIKPGEEFPLTITLKNIGSVNTGALNATLRSDDPFFTVPDSLGYYSNIAAGQSLGNSSNTFTVHARGSSIVGMIVPLTLELSSFGGFSQTLNFEIMVGEPGAGHPLGQDTYGYFIFDDGDTFYQQCPIYQWVGIAPAEGGSGVALNITDPGIHGDEGDQLGATTIQTVDLPFNFRFYGVEYSRASISSNGFISFGETTNSDWRNWRIPDAGGPNQMIAAFWDDLEFGGDSGVYTYHDTVNHNFVVEWYKLRSGYDRSSEETFQAILYDPTYHPTHTNDGQIKLQYKVINNIDTGTAGEGNRPHGNYATVGIENHTGTVGLEYTFNNSYPDTAKILTNEMALLITTRPILPDYAYLGLLDVQVLDPNHNGILEPGETASVVPVLNNYGLQNALGVSATLSTTDPYITINNSYSSYGNINAQASGTPLQNFGVSVAANCPTGHRAQFVLQVNSVGASWTLPFMLTVHSAEFSLQNQIISDGGGNNNGILDPGETVSLSIRLYNDGLVAAAAGSATLSSNSQGITINNGSSSFNAIAPGDYATLNFNLSAAETITTGSLINLNFNISSGMLTYTQQNVLEVGAPIVLYIGSGSDQQTYPLDRYYNYSSSEGIYLSSEINMPCLIKTLAYEKTSGADTNPIQNVQIYMKNTSETSLASGSYDLTGYTLVYTGNFPNTATSGWMEVTLDEMFFYDGLENLAILVLKGHQSYITNYPYWKYTTTTTRARHGRSDGSQPVSLSANSNLPNLQLRIFPQYDAQLPPRYFEAFPSHQSVVLQWQEPAVGNPSAYKIFRNNALLTTVAGLSYTDLAVSNGTSYTYYLKSVFDDGDSDPTEPITVTPNMMPPTNLTAAPGNNVVLLEWELAEGRGGEERMGAKSRAISSYKIYRNGVALTTVPTHTYLDENVANGNTYSYYVTTVYTNPAGESAPSNTVSTTPNPITSVVIGTGTGSTGSSTASPINVYYKSLHGQSVYTRAELNAAGIIGSSTITHIGFNITGTPGYAMPNFKIRMGHTSATNASSWISTGLTQVWIAPSYQPTATGWEMYQLQTPFLWNGTDNIVVDTAFGLTSAWSSSGTVQYTSVTSGYRYMRSDSADYSDMFSGGSVENNRPNLKINFVSADAENQPPRNFSASASHRSVRLSWQAPASGSPTGYKIYRNNLLLTTVTTLTYTDTAVNNGNTYSYYLKAMYGTAESVATETVDATPNALAPTNLQAVSGNGTVALSWMAAEGREADGELETAGRAQRVISSYKVYRDGIALGTVTGTNYTDDAVVNGVTYTYYVTTVYTNPAGESAPSNSVEATPSSLTYVIIGTGTQITGGQQNAPLNICNNSVHGQLIYTAAEMNAAGVTGPVLITGLGFDLVTAPALPLPDFIVRMKHTSAVNGNVWQDATGLVTTYNNPSYMPTAGGWTMVEFHTPFLWNGVDNILVDTAFGLVSQLSQTGTMRYETMTAGYRFAWNNTIDQTDVFEGGTAVSRRYNIRFALQDPVLELESPVVSIQMVGANRRLSWAEVPNASRYLIFRADDPLGSYVQIGSTSQQYYIDNAVLPRAFYQVQAVNP